MATTSPKSTTRHAPDPAPPTGDRLLGAFAATAGVVLGTTVLVVAGNAWPIVLYRLVFDGGLALVWLLSAIGLGASILRVCRIPWSQSKSLNIATSAAAGLGAMSLAVLGLGLVGWINRAAGAGIILLGLLLGAGWLVRKIRTKSRIEISSKRAWPWLPAVAIAAIAMVAAFVPPGLLWGDEPNGYDVVEYHLQVPREWYEAGRIVPLEHNVFSYFPFNVEMHYLLAMELDGGPWEGMYLAQLMHAAFVALCVIAVYGATRRIVPAVLVAATPWMLLLAPIAYDEGGLLLFGTLAIVWAIRAAESVQPIRCMMLAGAMAGLACGAKLTAVPIVLIAVPLSCAIFVLPSALIPLPSPQNPHPDPLPAGEGIVSLAAFVFAGLVTFSPWLVRNFAWTRNPVFPEAMSVFGRAHFTPTQAERFDRAHSPRPDQRGLLPRFEAGWLQIVTDWRYGFVLLPLGIVAIALSWRSRSTQFLVILLLLHAIFWLFFTHLQGRFFVLAIPILALLVAQVKIKGWSIIGFTAALVSACVGLAVAGGQDANNVNRAQPILARVRSVAPAIGVENLQALLPDVMNDALKTDRPVALAGDARAFLYQVPMSRLTYRTVFDVDVRPNESVIAAWVRGSPDDAIVVVDPSELRRFAATYFAIPQPPTQAIEPYIIDPKSSLR